MCCARQMLEQLNDSERSCLRDLCRGRAGERMMTPHCDRLIELGLAELVAGSLEPTGTGKRAADLLAA